MIERSNELEGQYLDEEEREIMEAYNGGPDLPPPFCLDLMFRNRASRIVCFRGVVISRDSPKIHPTVSYCRWL